MDKFEKRKLINELADRYLENARSYSQVNNEIREQLKKIGVSICTLWFIARLRNKEEQ
ncbi:MAG: hypothetical protein ORN24_01895 [Burkholderiales bacterium]|nr:hypothetical protein [Burkholderiales bacterium]